VWSLTVSGMDSGQTSLLRKKLMKYERREKEVVDALQFTGGEKEGRAMARLINQSGASASWVAERTRRLEAIHIVTERFSAVMNIGDWLLFFEDGSMTHLCDDDFKAKYVKVRFRSSVLIWKDIPGFPNWQVSDNGRVRNTGYSGYKQRTRKGDFILRRNGEAERWSESQLGTEEQIKAFFAA
jgi:hypothetical protein